MNDTRKHHGLQCFSLNACRNIHGTGLCSAHKHCTQCDCPQNTECVRSTRRIRSYNFLVYMNLFVLSGLSTNIPIGFFFCFHAVSWWFEWVVGPLRCTFVASFVGISCSITLNAVAMGPYTLVLSTQRSTAQHCTAQYNSQLRRTIYDWHISHHFPALCLLTLFRFAIVSVCCVCFVCERAYFNDVDLMIFFFVVHTQQFGLFVY